MPGKLAGPTHQHGYAAVLSDQKQSSVVAHRRGVFGAFFAFPDAMRVGHVPFASRTNRQRRSLFSPGEINHPVLRDGTGIDGLLDSVGPPELFAGLRVEADDLILTAENGLLSPFGSLHQDRRRR